MKSESVMKWLGEGVSESVSEWVGDWVVFNHTSAKIPFTVTPSSSTYFGTMSGWIQYNKPEAGWSVETYLDKTLALIVE